MTRHYGTICGALAVSPWCGAAFALGTAGCVADAAARAQARRSAGSPEHAAGRLQRPAGAHRLSCRRSSSRAGATSPMSGHHGGEQGESGAAQSAQQPERAQRHLDPRRDRSQESEIPRPHSGRGRRRRGRRLADDAGVRRQDARQGRSQPGVSAAHLRPRGPRGPRRDRSVQAEGDLASSRDDRHPQEFMGVRERHRLSRVAAARAGARASSRCST